MARVLFDPETGELIEEAQDPLVREQIEAETATEEEGPTASQPFRFTQQSISEQAGGTTDRTTRVPIARSPALRGLTGMDMPTMYQDRLPMREATIASGDISQYRDLEGFGGIRNVNTLRGREALAGLEGFEGDTVQTNIFDMMTIGKGMGWDEDKVNQMLDYKPPGREQAMYKGVSTRDQRFAGPSGLISDRERQKLLDDGMTRRMGRGEVEQVKFDPKDFQRVYNLSKDGKGAFGKDFSDEERLFMGLTTLSDKGDFGGKQKGLDLDLDDPRHMNELTKMGYNYAVGRGGRIPSRDKGLFYQQRGIDRRFRKAGRESGSIWENPGKLIQAGVIAAMGAMVSGGLLAGPLAGMMAAGGGSAIAGGGLAGAAGGLTSGTVGGFASGQRGLDLLKSAGMGLGIGAAGGALAGGLSGLGAQGSTGLSFQAPGTAGRAMLSGEQVAQLGITGVAGGSVVPMAALPNIQAPANFQINPATGMYEQIGAAGGAGAGISGAQGVGTAGGAKEAGFLENVGNVVKSPATRRVAGGLQSEISAAQSRQQGLAEAMAAQAEIGQEATAARNAQAQAAGIQRQRAVRSIFEQNPYYDPIEDPNAAQAGVF